MRAIAWTLFYLCVTAVGFIVVHISLSDAAPPVHHKVPTDITFRLSKSSFAYGVVGKGWSSPEKRGVWATSDSAELSLPVERSSMGDIALHLEAVTKSSGQAHPTTVHVNYNGEDLGTWTVIESGSKSRWFNIPETTFNRSRTGKLSLRVEKPPEAQFGLSLVKILDAESLQARGALDLCTTTAVAGWATVNAAAVEVRFMVGGKALKGETKLVSRPDLVPIGLPIDAGFTFVPSEPLPPGAIVEAMYATGRTLTRKPCTIR